jgi:hypothetical protein
MARRRVTGLVIGKRLWLLLITAALVPASSCVQVGAPSTADCMMRWNTQANAASQAAVVMASFSRATVFGWGGEGGDYCFATLFTRQGEPWATYALWLDAPTPGFQFGRNTTGLRYGTGELGAEVPVAANAVVQMNGSLGSL